MNPIRFPNTPAPPIDITRERAPDAEVATGVSTSAMVTESAMSLVMLEIMRMTVGAEGNLKNIATDMKAVNDKLRKVGELEQKFRDATSDGIFEQSELDALRASVPAGFETQFEAVFAATQARLTEIQLRDDQTEGAWVGYNPYSSDDGVKESSRIIDTIKETIAQVKDSLNGTMSELQPALQLALGKKNQSEQLQSNALSADNQTAMAIIGNIRA